MQNALKSAGMSFQAEARASRDTCSDLMHVSNAPAADDLSPIISALAFARMPHTFLMSMLGRLLSFAMVTNVVKTTTAAERAIVDFGIMFFSYLCSCLCGLSSCTAVHLLRMRIAWPSSRRATKQRDELAPLHSITSSARASSVGGTVRPSALAVFRLITNSKCVGCKMGISAGFDPFRICPT